MTHSPAETARDRLLCARALLQDLTPLKADCGRRCSAACCQPDAEGQGGMLLFPGEEALYAPRPGWASLSESGLALGGRPLHLLTCDGACDRALRPLACRIFPLTPFVDAKGTLTLRLDVRAWPVCPLMAFGLSGLSGAFVAATEAAMRLLWEDPLQRAYMELLTAQLTAFGSLENLGDGP